MSKRKTTQRRFYDWAPNSYVLCMFYQIKSEKYMTPESNFESFLQKYYPVVDKMHNLLTGKLCIIGFDKLFHPAVRISGTGQYKASSPPGY